MRESIFHWHCPNEVVKLRLPKTGACGYKRCTFSRNAAGGRWLILPVVQLGWSAKEKAWDTEYTHIEGPETEPEAVAIYTQQIEGAETEPCHSSFRCKKRVNQRITQRPTRVNQGNNRDTFNAESPLA
jgi:hypothetical protein